MQDLTRDHAQSLGGQCFSKRTPDKQTRKTLCTEFLLTHFTAEEEVRTGTTICEDCNAGLGEQYVSLEMTQILQVKAVVTL